MPDFDAQTVRYDEPDTFLPLDDPEIAEAQIQATDDYVQRWHEAHNANIRARQEASER